MSGSWPDWLNRPAPSRTRPGAGTNYFGEALLWWGFWLCAVDEPYGWLTVYAPALMTFLLVRVSGVALLDAHLADRPGYADYMKRTPGFVPRLSR